MIRETIGVLRSVRPLYWVLLALVAAATFSVTYYRMTSAACYSGNVLGRACYRGYFSNTRDTGGGFVLPVISNNQAIPNSINTADELYNLLRSAYNSGSAQRRTGAAFIYNTMMGLTAPGTGRTVSNTEWTELRNRLRALDSAGKINWTGNVSVSINSYWQGTDEGFPDDGTTNDDAYYENHKNEAGITVRDYNNNVVYQILRRCANPVGRPDGIPPTQNYTLTPHVDTISPTQIEAGSKMNVATSVDNVGEVNSKTTRWEITQINVSPGQQAPHENDAGASATAPCQSGGGNATGNYFANANATCDNVAGGSGVFNLGAPAQNLKPSRSNIDIGDLEVGTRVCFALSVKDRSNSDTRWMHSRPVCTTVGKKPKVQVWGGDVRVRGQLEASTSVKEVGGQPRVFGSWVEYGAFSIGVNSRFASGSGLNDQSDNSQVAWSKLTFANVDGSGTPAFGNFASAASFPAASNAASYFAGLPNKQPVGAGSVSLNGLSFATGDAPEVRTAGNLTITGSTIGVGRSVVILSTGTVTISGDIRYTDDDLDSLDDIPQVVIIANNINIQSGVGRVDAWLIASGTINTCSNFTGNLTSEKCNDELVVNGPVITNRLVLNRTAGAGTGGDSGDPAERFNLRPDAYLWAQLQASGNNKAQTVYMVELPPRF